MATMIDVLERRSVRPAAPKKACSILVPTDFSASADAALEYATFLAWRIGATLDMLHVWDLEVSTGQEVERALATERSAKMAALEALSNQHRKTGVKIRSRLVFGDIASSIARVANQGEFDLIVMGTQDRPPSSPSIKSLVMRSVRCPVIHMRTLRRADLLAHQPLDVAALRSGVDHDAIVLP
jgi:nucleotide-binding universal stress UspA family protein